MLFSNLARKNKVLVMMGYGITSSTLVFRWGGGIPIQNVVVFSIIERNHKYVERQEIMLF